MGFFDFIGKIDNAMETQRQTELRLKMARLKAEKDMHEDMQEAKLKYMAINSYDPYAQLNSQQAAYNQQQGAQNQGLASGYVTTTSGTGGITFTGNSNWTVTPGSINNNVNAVYATQTAPFSFIPAPSGVSTEVTLIEDNGVEIMIRIDEAYVEIIQQISAQHKFRLANVPKALPDPEFDLDEIATATELLEDLYGERPKGP